MELFSKDQGNTIQFIEKKLAESGFDIVSKDLKRPWGGFFVINEDQSEKFISEFFTEINRSYFEGKISPKVLVVMPGKKISWQYHSRRAELWKVVEGEVGIVTSQTDSETEMKRYLPGSKIILQKGERHRLIGLESTGIVAEIWQHTEIGYPSDEADIIRLQDDFGR